VIDFIREKGTRRWVFYSILTAALSSIVMGVVAIQYANYAIHQSQLQSNKTIIETQQQWCEIIITFDNGYRNTPPTTPTGKLLAEEFARLRREFQCQKG